MRAGKIANTQLILNNWFLLMISVFALAGMAGKVLLVFSSVIWHETAHALTARCLGLKVREIELLFFGGVARIEGLAEAGCKAEALIAAAGPLSSLLLAALAVPALYSPLWGETIRFFIEVNVTLAVFNLLPALPLDGGRIVRAWLTVVVNYDQATRLVTGLTYVITLFLAAFAGVQFVIAGTLHLSLIFAALLLVLAAGRETRTMRYRAINMLAKKKAILAAKGSMPAIHIAAMGSTLAREIVQWFVPERYALIQVLDEYCRSKGTLTETELWENLPQHGANARIDEFLAL